jgi:hypothetical protein
MSKFKTLWSFFIIQDSHWLMYLGKITITNTLFCIVRAAFEKEIEGLPTTRSVGDLPPELRCPLCKEVMKDAVLTSKCCFRSFCDKCMLCFTFLILILCYY